MVGCSLYPCSSMTSLSQESLSTQTLPVVSSVGEPDVLCDFLGLPQSIQTVRLSSGKVLNDMLSFPLHLQLEKACDQPSPYL